MDYKIRESGLEEITKATEHEFFNLKKEQSENKFRDYLAESRKELNLSENSEINREFLVDHFKEIYGLEDDKKIENIIDNYITSIKEDCSQLNSQDYIQGVLECAKNVCERASMNILQLFTGQLDSKLQYRIEEYFGKERYSLNEAERMGQYGTMITYTAISSQFLGPLINQYTPNASSTWLAVGLITATACSLETYFFKNYIYSSNHSFIGTLASGVYESIIEPTIENIKTQAHKKKKSKIFLDENGDK